MNTTKARMLSGNENILDWIKDIVKCFETEEHFDEACEEYSFATAYNCGQTPSEAYRDYIDWMK